MKGPNDNFTDLEWWWWFALAIFLCAIPGIAVFLWAIGDLSLPPGFP